MRLSLEVIMEISLRIPGKAMLVPALLLVLVAGGFSAGCAPSQGTRIGNTAPDFELPALEGENISLSSLRGSPVLLNFWATWCPPCREEMPYLQSIHQKWSGMGLRILAIDVGESPSTVRKFIEERAFTFTVLLDADQRVALEKYNVRNIPTSYFIDKEGKMRGVKIGAFSGEAEIEEYLLKLFGD